MMSDDLVEPVDTELRSQGEGLADQAARAVVAYRDGDRAPLAALVQVMTPLLWHTVRAQGADTETGAGHRAEHVADARAGHRVDPGSRGRRSSGCS